MTHGAATAFADNLVQSFEHFGFAMICDHGLDPALVERGWALAKALFAQPEEVKRAYHAPGGGGQRGYTPLGTEIARDATENDLKEFWHIGRDLPPDILSRRQCQPTSGHRKSKASSRCSSNSSPNSTGSARNSFPQSPYIWI